MDIVFSSAFPQHHHAIKLGVLYCDRMILPADQIGLIRPDVPITDEIIKKQIRITGRLTDVYSTFTDEIEASLKPLFAEGLLVRAEVGSSTSLDNTYAFQDALDDVFGPILKNKSFEGFEFHISLMQVEADKCDLGTFVALLAASAYKASIKYDGPILTDNMLVDALLTKFIERQHLVTRKNAAKQKIAFLTHRVLNEFVPDIGDASFEDVLELRHRFRNELGSFRNKMAIISEKIRANPWEAEIKSEVDRLIEVEIKPETANLKLALRNSNSQLVTRVFRNVKDARTYIPFVGTVLGHIEPSIAVLASAGIAGFEALYETIIERRKIRDTSGLVFLLKGPRELSKMVRREDRTT